MYYSEVLLTICSDYSVKRRCATDTWLSLCFEWCSKFKHTHHMLMSSSRYTLTYCYQLSIDQLVLQLLIFKKKSAIHIRLDQSSAVRDGWQWLECRWFLRYTHLECFVIEVKTNMVYLLSKCCKLLLKMLLDVFFSLYGLYHCVLVHS